MDELLMIGLSFIFFFIGSSFLFKVKKICKHGEKVEGVVFDIVASNNIESRTKYPVIKFLTLEQEWVTKKYEIGMPLFFFKKGDRVSVIYDRQNPNLFFVKSKTTLLVPILALTLAAIFLTIAMYKLYMRFSKSI
jgi:hypothetical protein